MNGASAGKGGAGPPNESMSMRILKWLTSGYPTDVPATDRYTMLAFLYRTLTADQLEVVVATLAAEDSVASAGGRISDLEISAMISAMTDIAPCEDDIRRVSARLAAAGRPMGATFHPASSVRKTPKRRKTAGASRRHAARVSRLG